MADLTLANTRPTELSEANLRKKNQWEHAVDDEAEDDDDATSLSSIQLRRSDSSLSVSFIDLGKLLLIPEYDFGSGVGDLTRKKLKDMKIKTQETIRKFTDDNRTRRFTALEYLRFQETFNARLSHFDNRVHRSLQSSAMEKLFYSFAVTLIAAAGYIIGKYPIYFPTFHTVVFCMLMPIRFYTYFKLGFQYYLADLCYYVNMLLMLFIWVFPHLRSLFISLFSLTFGTLAFAVITWRNSLVLHSIEKTTSSFIHVMPCITMFTLVHQTPVEYRNKHYPATHKVENWNFVSGIIWTSVYYTIWQVGYHYFITVRRSHEIAKGRVTSFTYLKKKNSKSPLGRFVNNLPYAWMQVAAFTLIQFGYQILTMLPCPIWYRYKHLCAIFVTFIFSWSAYNGATYYIEVFGKRFEKEVKQLRSELNEMQSKLDSKTTTPLTSPTVNPTHQAGPVDDLKLEKNKSEA